MTRMMPYGTAVGWDDQADAYVATCSEFPGLSCYGDTAEAAQHTLEVAVADIVRGMLARGEAPPVPQGGPFSDAT